jgi:hypothetical protein
MSQDRCINCGEVFDDDEQSSWKDFTCSHHPMRPRSIGNTGPRGDYAELWYFPCCGKGVVGAIVNGCDVCPPQSPGCVNTWHSSKKSSIFMSYARSDNIFAQFLDDELKRRGYHVWRDTTDIVAGMDWKKYVDEAIEASTHLILIVSKISISRPEVQHELYIASKLDRHIIPILSDDCEMPTEIKHLNFIDWRYEQGKVYSDNFNRLDEALGDPRRMRFLERLRGYQ